MEDTCFGGCRYRDKKGKYKETCPDFIRLSWTSESGEIKTTEDCARRRALLLMMNWDQRLIGVQRSAEEGRNAALGLIDNMIEMAKKRGLVSGNDQLLVQG